METYYPENQYPAGSPQWFHEMSLSERGVSLMDWIEDLREKFIESFGPDSLAGMDGRELLEKVFGNRPESMIRLLMFDDDYRNFGACGKDVYNSPLYLTRENGWVYNEGGNRTRVSEAEAVSKAEYVRDLILRCVRAVESGGKYDTIDRYIELDGQLSRISFSKYAWMLKYYQMIFPYAFPGMYSDGTLKRAFRILGFEEYSLNVLRYGKFNSAKRLVNMGIVSLFIRKCDVHNIVFNDIYGHCWGWETPAERCENADDNARILRDPVSESISPYYRIPGGDASEIRHDIELVQSIEEELDSLGLQGAERETVVRVRVNQGEFRSRLLKKYRSCRLCGVTDERFLIASHIKPWSVAEPNEKLDPENGFLLCPNHDKLFDQGFISFDDLGRIMISSQLSENERTFLNVIPSMAVRLSQKNRQYLAYHREKVFKL